MTFHSRLKMLMKQSVAVYFGYLAAIKTQNGAAMSVGRISTFLDVYIERDMLTVLLQRAKLRNWLITWL